MLDGSVFPSSAERSGCCCCVCQRRDSELDRPRQTSTEPDGIIAPRPETAEKTFSDGSPQTDAGTGPRLRPQQQQQLWPAQRSSLLSTLLRGSLRSLWGCVCSLVDMDQTGCQRWSHRSHHAGFHLSDHTCAHFTLSSSPASAFVRLFLISFPSAFSSSSSSSFSIYP